MKFLREYIKGERYGKEANRLEKASLEDAFLYGAIEGYDLVEGDHDKAIGLMEQKVLSYHVRKAKQVFFIRVTSIAAGLLLIIFAGFIFFKTNTTTNTQQHLISKATPIPPKQAVQKQEQKQQQEEQPMVRATIAFPPPVISQKAPDTIISQASLLKNNAVVSSATMQGNTSNIVAIATESPIASEEIASPSSSNKKAVKKTYFGKLQFEQYFYRHATKNICNADLNTVKVTFDIDTNHRPANINFQEFTCNEAKAEVLRWLKASPDWDETSQQIKLELSW